MTVASRAEDGSAWSVALHMPQTPAGWSLKELLDRAQAIGSAADVIHEYATRVTVDLTFLAPTDTVTP